MRIDANTIKTIDRWECDDYVIFNDDDGSFMIAQIKADGDKWMFGMNSDHELWFQSYAQARKHLKEEAVVEGRFVKVKGEGDT